MPYEGMSLHGDSNAAAGWESTSSPTDAEDAGFEMIQEELRNEMA